MAPVGAARRLDADAAEVRRARVRIPALARRYVRRLDVRLFRVLRGREALVQARAGVRDDGAAIRKRSLSPRVALCESIKFYQFVLFVISLWILQVVLKFWRYLSAVDPARARILASPRRRHAASQAAHNERAVRRLESGASD